MSVALWGVDHGAVEIVREQALRIAEGSSWTRLHPTILAVVAYDNIANHTELILTYTDFNQYKVKGLTDWAQCLT